MKATYVEINGKGREIFKDPITDDGTKKSATGLLSVFQNHDNGDLELYDRVDWSTESKGELKDVYIDGRFIKKTTLTDIRKLLKS